jgi:hypothetical protein
VIPFLHGLKGLIAFITIMWLMLLGVAAFLIFLVPSLDHLSKPGETKAGRITISIIQAAVSIGAVVLFIIGLSRLKKIYVNKKLHI